LKDFKAMPLVIEEFITRSDNYAVLVHDPASGATVSIDAPDAAPIAAKLREKGWRLTDILVTHKHMDHVEGIGPLKEAFGCKVTGPAKSAREIPHLDTAVSEGDRIVIGGQSYEVWETPGHCADHICLLLAEEKIAFVGDTLFAIGCGRVLDSTIEALHRSLRRLEALPDATNIYCGHEYTLANARFALTVDPENQALIARAAEIETLRAEGRMTLPTTIGLEKATNPYFRIGTQGVQAALNMVGAAPVAITAEIRERKNRF
jgi:hydroxyacylglutathione hydrolase